MSRALHGGLNGQARLLKLAEIQALRDAVARLKADSDDPNMYVGYLPGMRMAMTLLRLDVARMESELDG